MYVVGVGARNQHDMGTRRDGVAAQDSFDVANQNLLRSRKTLAAGERGAVIGDADGEVHQTAERGQRRGNVAGSGDEQHGRRNERLNGYFGPRPCTRFDAAALADCLHMGFASENGVLRGLDDLLCQLRGRVGKRETAQSGTIFVDEYVLTSGWTPGSTGGDDSSKHTCLLALQCLTDSMSIILHRWLL